MSHLKNLKIVILILGILLILVIVRNANQNIFKEKVEKAIEFTHGNGNLITFNQLKLLSTPFLVLNIGNESSRDSLQFPNYRKIPFEKLLDKENRKFLTEAKGEIILFSWDVATSSKAWVILNQLGYGNVRILTQEENPEVLKYKFQPDTTARLENDSI